MSNDFTVNDIYADRGLRVRSKSGSSCKMLGDESESIQQTKSAWPGLRVVYLP